MAGVDFKVIFEEGIDGGAPAEAKGGDPGKSPGSSFGPGPKSESLKGPKPVDFNDAMKGFGRFVAGETGLGPAVGMLENLAKHLGNLYSAVTRGPSGPSKSPGLPSVAPSASSRVPSVPGAPPITQAAGGGAAAGEAGAGLGPLAAVAASAAVALAAVAAGCFAVKKAFDAIHAEGERIQGYSAELSQAYAMSDIRSELADMRRANKIGPNAARVENMRSKVDAKLADVVTAIYAALAKFLAEIEPAIPVAVNSLGAVAAGIELNADFLKLIYDSVFHHAEIGKDQLSVQAASVRLHQAMVNLLNNATEKDDIDDPFTAQLLAQWAAMAAAPGGGGRAGGIRGVDGMPRMAPDAARPAPGTPGKESLRRLLGGRILPGPAGFEGK